MTVVNESSPLTVSLDASPDPVQPGETIMWTVTVANRGPGALEGVQVTALVPDWLYSWFNPSSGLSVGGSCPGNCDIGETASWTVGSLGAGQRILTMSTKVGNGATTWPRPPDGTLIQTVAIAKADGGYCAMSSHTVIVDKTP